MQKFILFFINESVNILKQKRILHSDLNFVTEKLILFYKQEIVTEKQ